MNKNGHSKHALLICELGTLCRQTDALHRLSEDKVPKINLSKSDRHNWHFDLTEQTHARSRDNHTPHSVAK